MSAEFTSRLDEFKVRHQAAIDHALVAAGDVLKTAVQRKHRGGYTTGKDSVGMVRNAIVRGFPVTEDGVRVIRVGIRGTGDPYTRGQADPATIGHISLFWELGHLRGGRMYRVEKWRPAAEESREAVTTKFRAEYNAKMNQGAV